MGILGSDKDARRWDVDICGDAEQWKMLVGGLGKQAQVLSWTDSGMGRRCRHNVVEWTGF
jgi:hypothetical protein